MKKKENIILGLGILCIILIIGIFKWGDYLIKNNYIQEAFYQHFYTTHNVNLPINTTYQCTNYCGPPGRCSKTGQQCLADNDCPGCQPYSPPLRRRRNDEVRGENDAGKMESGRFLYFSKLTTDIGTQAKRYHSYKNNTKAPEANFGPNLWRSKYNQGVQLYRQRYIPQNLLNMSKYPYRYSTTGEFLNSGPLAANAYFS